MNKRRGTTLIEVAALSGIIGLLATATIPSIFEAREAARRSQCKNNLHQQAIAMHNYHDTHRVFPPGWVQHSWNADEPDAWGWGVMLSPYLDEARRYNMIDVNVPPSEQDLRFVEAIMQPIPSFRCPSDPSEDFNGIRGDWSTSNYAVSFGSQPPPRWETGTLSGFWPGAASTPREVNGVAWCNSSCGIYEMTDGTSNTIMIGERSLVSSNATWVGVRGNQFECDTVSDLGRHSPINGGPGSISSVHAGGVHIAMCDGYVRFISDRINLYPEEIGGMTLLERLAARNDNQVLDYRVLDEF